MQQNAPLSQQELLTDLLSQEKQCVKDYAGNITEASCTNLRQLLLDNMTECATDQYCVFDEMRTRNLYKTKDAPDNDVQTAKQEMQTLKQQTGM